MIVYFNGKYIEENDVKISPFDRGFQYADGVYEVLRTYNKKYFMINEHIERLKYSLTEIKIDYFDYYDKLPGIFDSLIRKNNFKDDEVTVYLQVTRGRAYPRTHQFPEKNTEPTVIVTVAPVISKRELNKNGIKIILEKDIRWDRCDIKSISLLPNVLINQKAKENGAHEAVWIKHGFLTEGTHTNFFGIKNGKVYSYPLSNNILPGITRMVISGLCSKLNIEFLNEGIKQNELDNFEEFFLTGTTTEVMPVTVIGDNKIGGGKPGEITMKIQSAFYELTSGY